MATAVAARPRLRPRSMPWPAMLAIAAGLATLVAALSVVAFLVDGVYSGPVDWLRLLTSSVWYPAGPGFGAAAMVWGTIAVCAIALLIATPLGWAAAIGLTELTPGRAARVLRTGVELLAAIPSIVYGLVGIAVLRPVVSAVFGTQGGDGLLTAGLVLAVMVLPTVVAVSVDALAAVPAENREAAAALGLTRTEVIRSAVLPEARSGMRAGVLLGLARALGETIAVFLVIGRADGRLPAPLDALGALVHPGQTLSTKLGGPEPVLAGGAGAHHAALSALGLLLFALVAAITVAGLRSSRWTDRRVGHRQLRPRLCPRPRGRRIRDRVAVLALRSAVVVPLLLVAGVLGVLAVRGAAGWHPQFWLQPATGASGGGVRDQVLGTVVLVAGTAMLAAPVGLGLGLLIAEYAGPRAARALRTATVTLGGVPSILLGLVAYDLVVRTLGWGKSWVAGVLALTVLVVPVAATVTATRLAALPHTRREAALALGLDRAQLARSVLVPWAAPGLLTGTLLGLARAAGETAPLLFAATVFAGAAGLPAGITDTPVVALPTHVFALAQDAADPVALDAAWGAALVLVLLAALLLLAAIPARRRMEAHQ
ncbi:MAG: phosphate ABC transporter permease subunit PstC [Pseudonocardiaceae bacterium]